MHVRIEVTCRIVNKLRSTKSHTSCSMQPNIPILQTIDLEVFHMMRVPIA